MLAAGVEPATKQLLKLLPLPVWQREQTKFGGSEGIQTLTKSVQNFYAVIYITNPKIKVPMARVELAKTGF